jgi:choline dehydrogenase
MYESEPEPELNYRRMFQPAGKLFGGTGAINGMAYVRGHRLDFDSWRHAGNPSWGYEGVLPYFKKSEDNVRGASAFHGAGGPLHVADQALHRTIGDAFVVAGQQAGYRYNEDFNGSEQDGVGHFQYTIRNGRRVNPAIEFLRGLEGRGLTVLTGALVERIEFDGTKAVSVRYRLAGAMARTLARREIIICAGTFNSPLILQRSGVGPQDILRRLQIPIVADLPGVGANYQDHFTFQVAFQSTLNDTINDDIGSLYRKVRMGLAYLVRRGPLSHTGAYAGGFIRTCPDLKQPDIELNLNLWTRKYTKGGGLLDRFSGFAMLPIFIRPDARGTVRIKSSDPDAAPEIKSNSFQTERDQLTMVRALAATRSIANAPALKRYVEREISPGPEIHCSKGVIDYVRQHGYTSFHGVGTCRMGSSADCVVDERLRVRSVNRLRVIDASIMPTVVSGNTAAASMMIAEKGAQMIIDDDASTFG